MTRPEDFLRELDDLKAEFANLSVQEKVVPPRTQKQVESLLERTQKVIEDVRAWQRKHEDEQRLAGIFKELGGYTALAHKRLEYVEKALGDRNGGSAFPADPKILAEGAWLKGMFAGPPTDDVDPRFLMNAPRPRVRRGLDELAVGALKTTSAREILKGLKK